MQRCVDELGRRKERAQFIIRARVAVVFIQRVAHDVGIGGSRLSTGRL